MSEGEDLLVWQIRAADLPAPQREWRFHPERRWRLDLAWPNRRVAVEVDGGAWVGGRHVSGAGFEADCLKHSWAAALGWRVLRVTPRMVHDGVALSLVMAALGPSHVPSGGGIVPQISHHTEEHTVSDPEVETQAITPDAEPAEAEDAAAAEADADEDEDEDEDGGEA